MSPTSHLNTQKQGNVALTARNFSTTVKEINWNQIYNHLNNIISNKYPAFENRVRKLTSYNTKYYMLQIAIKIQDDTQLIATFNKSPTEATNHISKIVSENLRICALNDENEKTKIVEDLSQGIKEVLMLDEQKDKNLTKNSHC